MQERLTRYRDDIGAYDLKELYGGASQEMCQRLGKLEDLIENADSIKIIKRNGIASLHIDMILDDETYPIAEELFGKDKSE